MLQDEAKISEDLIKRVTEQAGRPILKKIAWFKKPVWMSSAAAVLLVGLILVANQIGKDGPKQREIGKQAILVAKTAKYYNAGTCEFMFKDGKYYFLEMNTRLQVEHPITEAITGVDLAREQLRIASGLELEYDQGDIMPRGHAIECRINAEDPLNNFIPAPSRIIRYAEPGGPGIRIDSGVYQGFTIPPFYDSMIAKLISWAEDRPRAIERTKRALWEFQISGVKHNIPFHQVVMDNSYWINGEYDTSFIQRYNILDQVVNFVKETKSKSSDKRTAAAMAAVQTVIMSSNSS